MYYSIPQPQDAFVALTAMVAVGVGSIAVDLQDVPNGPMRFMVNHFHRYELKEISFFNRMIQRIRVVMMIQPLLGLGEHLSKIHRMSTLL